MRILTLNYEFPPIGGGGSPVSYELGRELVAQGHDVDVVTMGFGGLPAHEVMDGMNVYRVPCLRKRREVCRTHEMVSFVLAALPKVARLVATRQYDLNHTHFIVPTGLLARLIKARTGLPFVVTVHGSDVPGYNPDRFRLEHRLVGPLWKWILGGADHLITPSQFMRRLVDRRPHGRPVTIIPNGFRCDRFRPDRPKERRILLVSRMLPRKGIQHLLAALPQIDLRRFEVDIVGDGPYLPTLKRMASELRLPVKFWGWLDNGSAELKELYERSSIFVFTSETENFPIVLLEAMAAGQAIVACDDTGCPEVVGSDALLVPPRSPDRLGNALSRLVQDHELRARLGRRARMRVEQEFGWHGIARRHVALYREVRSSGRPAGSRWQAPSATPPSQPRVHVFERNVRQMKVCFVVNEFFGWGKYGGFGSATRMIATGLAAKGVEVDVVTPIRRGQASIERAGGVTVRGFQPWSLQEQIAAYRASDADIYHSEDPSMGTLLCQRAMPGRRHIVTCRDPRTARDWWIELSCYLGERRYKSMLTWIYEDNPLVSRAVRRADAVFGTAKHIVPKARTKYGLKAVPGFLPTPVPVKDALVAKADRPTVCFVGRFDKRKRPELFFELARRCPDVQFIAVGAANSARMDRLLRRRCGDIGNLELTGFLDRFASPRFAEILSRSWVLVNTAAREGLPVTFIEAAAYRCAILSRVNPDEFASRFGYHAEAGDFEVGLRTLLENDRWRALGEAAYDYVRTTHAIDVVIEKHLEVYASLTAMNANPMSADAEADLRRAGLGVGSGGPPSASRG